MWVYGSRRVDGGTVGAQASLSDTEKEEPSDIARRERKKLRCTERSNINLKKITLIEAGA